MNCSTILSVFGTELFFVTINYSRPPFTKRSHNEYDLETGIQNRKAMVAIQEIPLNQIRRPLPRQTDAQKVETLMASIAREGLREPIDVLEVDGEYYGFSGCHRYEAHQRLGKATIRCRVRRAPKSVLQRHLA
jgi:sulfiredoxin